MKKRICSFALIIAMLAMFVPSGMIATTVFAGEDGFTIENGALTAYTGAAATWSFRKPSITL